MWQTMVMLLVIGSPRGVGKGYVVRAWL